MKAVVSNRIYLEVTPELKKSIEKEVTYQVPPAKPGGLPITIRNMVRIKDNLISIPVGRLELIPEHYEIVEKRVLNPVQFPNFKFTLRESQQKVYDAVDDNAIINAWVSWGKTFSGLAIAGKLGQKTLIVVHTLGLLDQWTKEIRKVFGIEPGIIARGQFNMDAPIVIGSTRSLYNNITKIRKEFGTLLLDEMHHCSSPTFSKIVDSSHARYKIGLSGTILRKDGKHVVFRDYFGSNVFKPPKENALEPEVHVVHSGITFPDGASVPWARRVNALMWDDDYRDLVSSLALTYAKKNHSILVLADRVEFLEECAKACGEEAVCITGATPNREELLKLVERREKKIIFGTQAIFSEGISENTLSCLILGTPVNNEPLLTQLIGRVIRIHDSEKEQPVVVDINLLGYTGKKQAMARLGHYVSQGYTVKHFEI